MKKFIVFFIIFAFFCTLSFSQKNNSSSKTLPNGYGGIELGMTLEQTKDALKRNSDFGYTGDRDVSLLPTENRILIETDPASNLGLLYLDRCYFQFYNNKLYIITINVNREKMDHYSIFDTLCKKYGKPNSVTPEKTTWKNNKITMTLEKPLTLKYVDQKTFDELQKQSMVDLSGKEMTREMFLEGL